MPAPRLLLVEDDPALSELLDASHGVTTNATASEISIPMLALIGIGLM